jgi:hypothetical protein
VLNARKEKRVSLEVALNMEAQSMLHTAFRRRTQVLALIIVLSILMTAVTAFAATKLISAKKGGTVEIAPGVRLEFRPNSLEEDTMISAGMLVESGGVAYEFGPDGTELLKPARLIVSWSVVEDLDLDDFILIDDEDGEEIRPKKKKKGLVYELGHFSRYYYRRR